MPYKQPPVEHQIKKGEIKNPNGRPKGTFSLINLLKAKIQECPEGEDKKTYADLIIQKMLKESVDKGDIQHIKTILAYIEGLPKGNDPFNGKGGFMLVKWETDEEQSNNDTIPTEEMGETNAPDNTSVDSSSPSSEGG